MIEFYDEENPRKRRSYSFSQSAPLLPGGVAGEGLCPQPPSHPKVFSISTSATISSAAEPGKGPTPLSAAVTAGAPTAARVLLKQRSEDPSVGRSSASTGLRTGSPTTPSEEASAAGRTGEGATEGAAPDDDHSDKGTYTIELESRNPEEEEARRMIDKVFGVDQNQNLDPSLLLDPKGGGCKEIGDPGKKALIGDSNWVSQWASVAANQTRTDPEGSGAETPAFLHKEREASSKRRTLPLLPLDDPRAKAGAKAPGGLRSEVGEKQDTELQEKESQAAAEHQGDGQAHTPMEEGGGGGGAGRRPHASSSAARSAAGSAERRRRAEEGREGAGEPRPAKALVRQGSFTVEKPSAGVPPELIPHVPRGAAGGRERSDSAGSMDTATLLKDTEAVMAFLEAKLRDEKTPDQRGARTGGPAKSSAPRAARTGSPSPESDVDTASTASQAAAEAGRRALAGVGLKQRRSLSSMHREKSNVSAASSRTGALSSSARERLERKTKVRPSEVPGRGDARRPAPPPASSRARQPSLDLTDDDQTSFPISDILSSDQESYSAPGSSQHRRRSSHLSADDLLGCRADAKGAANGAARPGRGLQAATAASLGKQAGLPQPRPTRASLLRRARLGDASDTDLGDADRLSVASEVSTTSSTSKPPSGRKGPSRLDMLAQPRRNRLGSISSARSDSECTVGRASASSSTRLSAETALRLGLRSSTPTESRLTPRMRANSVSKLTETRGKTAPTASGYCSPTDSPDPVAAAEEETQMVSSTSRWRRLPPEYGSTSEEEFGSNRSSAQKHGGRPHLRPPHPVLHRGSASRLASAGAAPGAGGASPGLVSSPGGVVMKHRMREQDEYIRDWTAHSEEIARISQDLAKDLAILAREIHDVAGEIDSVSSSGTAPSTTASTAATTPGSAIDTREELVDRVFDESLNFRKTPPAVSTNKAPEINGKPVELRPRAPDRLEPRALRRRTWNREEAVLDSLLLTSVTQLSSKIRQSVDRTAGKLRILFKDKERNWEEIESKLRSDGDLPHLKTANKEFSSILLELKRVEKQLQVIDVMVDPDGSLDALASLGSPSPPSPTAATAHPPALSSGAAPHPPLQGSLPEITSGPVTPSPPAKGQGVPGAGHPEPARGLAAVGVPGAGIGGLPFGRIRPSGEEAIAQK